MKYATMKAASFGEAQCAKDQKNFKLLKAVRT